MGSSTSRLQAHAHIDAQTQALQVLNVNNAFTSVLQQLERLERLLEGRNRSSSIKRNPYGDANHTTIETNQAALSLKLTCLNGILQSYQEPTWSADCARCINSWYQDRREQSSPIMIEAVLDSVNACQGKYQRRVMSYTASLQPDELTHCSQGLVLACEDFHRKQEKVKAAPEAFLAKVQKSKEQAQEQVPDFNIDYFIATLESDLASSKAKVTQSQETDLESDPSQMEDPVPRTPRSLDVHTLISRSSHHIDEARKKHPQKVGSHYNQNGQTNADGRPTEREDKTAVLVSTSQ